VIAKRRWMMPASKSAGTLMVWRGALAQSRQLEKSGGARSWTSVPIVGDGTLRVSASLVPRSKEQDPP
jgi:hypothetical protein